MWRSTTKSPDAARNAEIAEVIANPGFVQLVGVFLVRKRHPNRADGAAFFVDALDLAALLNLRELGLAQVVDLLLRNHADQDAALTLDLLCDSVAAIADVLVDLYFIHQPKAAFDIEARVDLIVEGLLDDVGARQPAVDARPKG